MNKNCIDSISSEANVALLTNKKLLDALAKRVRCDTFDDAKQTLYEAFLRCYTKFDRTKGNISTFICNYVLPVAYRLARKRYCAVRVPMYIQDIWTQLANGKVIGTIEEFRELKERGVSPYVNLKEQTYRDIVDMYHGGGVRNKVVYALQKQQDEYIEEVNKELSIPEQIAEDKINTRMLQKLLDCLPDKHRFVIENYYGLNNYEPKTLREIACILGLSTEALAKRRLHALSKMYNLIKKGNRRLSSARMTAIYLNELNKKDRKKG